MMALFESYRIKIIVFQLIVITYSVAFCTTPVIVIETNSSMTQNVTPCFSSRTYTVAIFNESSTWSEAKYSCKQMSYKGLIATNAGWKQWFHVRDVLQDAGFPENMTFWEGHFRPYFHVAEWYKLNNDACVEYSADIISGDVNEFHQCAAVQWETYTQQQRLIARNCSEMLPYMCYKSDDDAYFLLYNGFWFGQHNATGFDSYVTETIHTFDDCAQTCRDDVSCLSFTFNYTSSNCTVTYIIYGFGYVTYEILPGFDNITHGVKTGCNVTESTTPRTFSVTGVDSSLPSCGLSPIPANYCQSVPRDMRNVTPDEKELDKIIAELINNLTVPADTTLKHYRKRTSASDLRPSATFFGSMGIIVMTVVISLPVLSDALTLYWKFHGRGKDGQSIKRKKV